MTPEPKIGMRIWFKEKGVTTSADQIETIVQIDEDHVWFQSSTERKTSLLKSNFKPWLRQDKMRIVEDEPKKLEEISLPITDRKEWF